MTMEVCFLVMAHKNLEQVGWLCRLLEGPDSDVLVEWNPDVGRGTVEYCKRVVRGLKGAIAKKPRWIVVISGQDAPVGNVVPMLKATSYRAFGCIEESGSDPWGSGLNLPSGTKKGDAWFALRTEDAFFGMERLEELCERFKDSHLPHADEIIFPTWLSLILGPLNTIPPVLGAPLVYLDWLGGDGSSPKLLKREDSERIKASGRYLARKFDMSIDPFFMEEGFAVKQG